MGRMGTASFTTDNFPAMLLVITMSSTSAYMWTWLGPSFDAPEVQEALRVVAEAREATPARGRDERVP